MMDDLSRKVDLKQLIDAPCANPLEINLPLGRRPLRRGRKPVYQGQFAPKGLSAAELKDRKRGMARGKLDAVLDYYAKSDVPFSRIAEHTNLSEADVIAAMRRRGRAS